MWGLVNYRNYSYWPPLSHYSLIKNIANGKSEFVTVKCISVAFPSDGKCFDFAKQVTDKLLPAAIVKLFSLGELVYACVRVIIGNGSTCNTCYRMDDQKLL